MTYFGYIWTIREHELNVRLQALSRRNIRINIYNSLLCRGLLRALPLRALLALLPPLAAPKSTSPVVLDMSQEAVPVTILQVIGALLESQIISQAQIKKPQEHCRGLQSAAGVLPVVTGMSMEDVVIMKEWDVVIMEDLFSNIRWQETSVLSVAEAEKDF